MFIGIPFRRPMPKPNGFRLPVSDRSSPTKKIAMISCATSTIITFINKGNGTAEVRACLPVNSFVSQAVEMVGCFTWIGNAAVEFNHWNHNNLSRPSANLMAEKRARISRMSIHRRITINPAVRYKPYMYSTMNMYNRFCGIYPLFRINQRQWISNRSWLRKC